MRSRKKYHDKTIQCHKLEVGDLVLLRDKKPGSNYKIADKWEDGVFEVVSQREDGPVFSVKQIGTNTEQVVHRNMIHPARSVMKDEVSKDRVSALAKANALMDVMFSD